MSSTDFLFLNLPALPLTLEQHLIEICKKTKINHNRLNRIKSLYPSTLSIAAQEYGTEQIEKIPDHTLKQIQALYSEYFRGGIFVALGVAKNLCSHPSVTPPHCDRGRQTAINYLLETGGSNVVTSFYTQKRKSFDLAQGENLNYDQVTLSSSVIIPKKTWCSFDAQQYHSVENINTERYYLSLFLYINPSFNDFKDQYKNLIL